MEENLNPQNPAQQTSEQLPKQPVQPVENQTQVSKPASKSKLPLILIVIFLFLIILGSGAYLVSNSNLKNQISNPQLKSQNLTPAQASILSPAPSTDQTANPDSIGANWKIYNNEKFTFRYPSNYFVKESVKDVIVILADENMPAQNAEISIDARLVEIYDNYNKAVVATKENLQEAKIEVIDNGIKISGKGKTGPSLGTQLTIALIKYNQGAIAMETTTTDSGKLQMFDQILSTFRFAP